MSHMAEKVEISEDDLTCPICEEVCREPVWLSCQHSFCRECLQLHSMKCDDQGQESDVGTSRGSEHEIICPLCRSRSNLNVKGVEGLAVQLALVSEAEKHRDLKSAKDKILSCSMCEEEEKKTAVSFCVNCSIFYCKECVAVIHPMRGSLKRHNLITVEEYLCQQKATGTTGITDDIEEGLEQCDNHGLQLQTFCRSCQQPFCNDCLDDHGGHPIYDIDGIYHKNMGNSNELNSGVKIRRKLNIRDNQISTPKLLFTEELSDRVNIRDSGNQIVGVYFDPMILISSLSESPYCGALTDGRLQTGSHFWELDLTASLKTESFFGWVCSAGVVRKVPDGTYVGGCNHSWGVLVTCINNHYRFLLRHNGQDQTEPVPVYPGNVSEIGTVRLGFYLNCEHETLTVVDCTNSRVLHTFRALDMSEPLTPTVSLHSMDKVDVSVQLSQGNISTLLKALPDVF